MRLSELRKFIKEMILKEMSTTAAVGGYQTPFAFKKKSKKCKCERKNFVNESAFKKAIFEDIINKVSFDIKFSDQATELMDFIKSNEKYEDDLLEIQQLFDKMKTDNTFSKEEAFVVYKEFIERASRDFIKETGENIGADEYFLRKDILDVIYYHLNKVENPMSGGKNDNIDTPPGVEASPVEAPPAEAPPAEAPPTEPGVEAPPAEAPPAEDKPTEEEPPKPEEIKELNRMVNELLNEVKLDARKLTVPEKHQLKIALDTLKMPDAIANVMGGPNKEEAIKILKKFGYSDAKIQKLLKETATEEAKYECPICRSKKNLKN